jgi:hypothetical protein
MSAQPDLYNTVLLLPLLSGPECESFLDAAEERHRMGAGTMFTRLVEGVIPWWESGATPRFRFGAIHDPKNECPESFHRMRVCEMRADARDLSSVLIRQRAIMFLTQHLPEVAERLFGPAIKRSSLRIAFSNFEPAVIRYGPSGEFERHRDESALTIVVPLSEPPAFAGGGGTIFFPEVSAPPPGTPESADGGCAVVINPPAGFAVFFNGQIWHASSPVGSGCRHLFVASFGLV